MTSAGKKANRAGTHPIACAHCLDLHVPGLDGLRSRAPSSLATSTLLSRPPPPRSRPRLTKRLYRPAQPPSPVETLTPHAGAAYPLARADYPRRLHRPSLSQTVSTSQARRLLKSSPVTPAASTLSTPTALTFATSPAYEPGRPPAVTVASSVWSPDGSKLAFPGNPAGLDYLSLIVLDTVTGKVNSLDAPLSIYRLEWDGEDAILAYGERSSPWRNAEVRIPLDGSPSTELFSIPQGSGSLAWSPNRLCYAFTVVRAGFKEETDIFARDGTLLTSVSDAGSPIWSPEGSMLALECGNGGPFKACVWPVDGTEPLRQLGDGRPEDWSGKGDAIAVSVWKDGGPKSVATFD